MKYPSRNTFLNVKLPEQEEADSFFFFFLHFLIFFFFSIALKIAGLRKNTCIIIYFF